jgi:hypothetical protein
VSVDLRALLDDIRARRGALTPDAVVEEAAAADHPLHDRFEWDDELAGHEYRVIQAGRLIRSVKVIVGESRVNAFVSLPVRAEIRQADSDEDAEHRRREYVAVDNLTEGQYQIHLRMMRLDIALLRRKYGTYKEFRAEILAALEDVA